MGYGNAAKVKIEITVKFSKVSQDERHRSRITDHNSLVEAALDDHLQGADVRIAASAAAAQHHGGRPRSLRVVCPARVLTRRLDNKVASRFNQRE